MNYINKIYFIIVLNAAVNFVHAERNKDTLKVNSNSGFLGCYAHYSAITHISNAQWRNFVSSYNAFTQPQKPLTDLKEHFSFDIGLRGGTSKFFFTLGWQHIHLRADAGFNFNETRRFDYKSNTAVFGLGIKIIQALNQKLNLFFTADMRVGGQARLSSAYIYRDGFESLGSEKELNGTFLTAGTLGSEFGLLCNYKLLKHLSIETKLCYQFNNSITPSTFDDFSNYKALNSGNMGVLSLPEDYKTYQLNGGPNYILSNGSEIKSNFKGYRIAFGLLFTL